MSTDASKDPYLDTDAAAERIWLLAQRALQNGESDRISDHAVRQIMTAAVKLYSAKTDGGTKAFRPVEGIYDEVVSPTEALVTAREVLRTVGLGPVEFGLWSCRQPEHYHLTDDLGRRR